MSEQSYVKRTIIYPILSREVLSSAFIGVREGCVNAGRPKRNATKE